MKTPDEIKKGLRCFAWDDVECCDCIYRLPETEDCMQQVATDALALIQQLERERDAAVDEIFQTCSNCKYEKQGYGVWPCPPAEEYVKTTDCSNWQWRGVQEVE